MICVIFVLMLMQTIISKGSPNARCTHHRIASESTNFALPSVNKVFSQLWVKSTGDDHAVVTISSFLTSNGTEITLPSPVRFEQKCAEWGRMDLVQDFRDGLGASLTIRGCGQSLNTAFSSNGIVSFIRIKSSGEATMSTCSPPMAYKNVRSSPENDDVTEAVESSNITVILITGGLLILSVLGNIILAFRLRYDSHQAPDFHPAYAVTHAYAKDMTLDHYEEWSDPAKINSIRIGSSSMADADNVELVS